MTPIEKFIALLERCYNEYHWRGWQMTGECSFASHGCFVAFQATIQDYEITLAMHDYRGLSTGIGYTIERSIYWRRNLSTRIKHWIEISVTDNRARHGRRAIVPRTVFPENDRNFQRLSALFEEIRAKYAVIRANAESRLSVEQSILAMCEDIEAKVSV